MKKIIFVIYILLNSVNNYAYTIDIPEKTTLSQDDLYLKGKVKAINISSDALQPSGLQNQIIMSIYFYENGLVKKIDSSIGASGQEFFYDKTFTKLIKHELFYSSNTQTKTNHLIGLVKDYSGNNPSQLIYSPPQATNLAALKRRVNYQDNSETIETFSLNSPYELNFTSKISNFYDPQTHRLIKSIKSFPNFFKKDTFDHIKINYNDYGISSIVSKLDTTQYNYKDNELFEIISPNKSSLNLSYSDYQYDLCGNWIQRKITNKDVKQITMENRKIEYYLPCK